MHVKEILSAGDSPSSDIEQVRSNPSLVEECKSNRETVPTRYEPVIGGNMKSSTGDVFEDFQPVAFFFLHRDKCPRRWFIKFVTWSYFERLSIFVIMVNCVTLGLYDPFDPECLTDRCQILDTMEKVIYAFFLAEMLCKWLAMGLFGKLAYFAESWNRLDCFIVAAGTFELLYNQGEYLSAVRAIRVLRPLRAIHRVPSIRILVTLLLDTLPMLWNVLAICFFIFAIFGIVGVQLWSGRLRGRCFLDLPANVSATSFNLTEFYIPADNSEFVCSMPDANGMKTCGGEWMEPYESSARECTLDYESYLAQMIETPNNSSGCVNWNQYYKVCKKEGDNPFWGAIGFDNIFIAWVAIFQVITLEGWSDIMYYVQDAHGLWNFIYFVILIVVASYFMTNLCLVVITTQFQETKHRENELLKESRRRQGTSTSTISSSRYGKDGCWLEILKYIEHLVRRFKRRMRSRFNWKYCETKGKRISRHKNRRRKKNKHVYHHHHHHHHHHHYHHHVHCTDPGCQYGQVSQHFPLHPGSLNLTPNVSPSDVSRLQTTQERTSTNGDTLNVPGQVPGRSETNNNNNGGQPKAIPTISIVTGSSCSVRNEPSCSAPGEMITTATAAVAVNGIPAMADVAAHSFLSAASLSSAAATATASAAAASAIRSACSCAMEHVGEDIKVNYESECVYEEDGASESDFSNEDLGSKTRRRQKMVSRFRHICRVGVESKWFTYIIMGAIFLNTLSMAIEYHGQPQKMTDVLETLNYIFTAVFAFEMLLKLMGLGPYGYIKDGFNLFDGFIVIMSIVELFGNGDSNISVLRSFRLLRIFKLVRFLPALRRQLMVMIHTMDNVMTFLALLVLFIFTASILGMNLFGGKYDPGARANFDDLFWALVTVFQILTQEDWNTVMYDGMRVTSKWAALYFILLMTIGNYILFNLLVAILVEGFANQPEKSESTCSVKSKLEPEYQGGTEFARCSEHPYPMVPPIVCVSPSSPVATLARTGSHDDLIRDAYKETADQEQYKGSSLPSLSPKSVLFRDECHVSAPASPVSTSPRITRKTLSFGDKRTMVIVNPVSTERCVTSEDENEMSTKEEDEQNVIVQDDSSWLSRHANWSLYLFSPSNRFRKMMMTVYSQKWFDRVVLFFIIFNCVVMALERPDLPKDSTMKEFIDVCMYIFLGIFTVEMMIKVLALGLWVEQSAYLRSGWNVMDGFLVIISWIDVIVTLTTDTESSILGVLRVFRALRTLRPLRVISRAPGLKIVVETLISSLKPIGNIVVIAATFFIIFGILGVQLFKGKFFHCKDKEYSEVVSKQDCIDQGSSWVNKEYNFDNLAKALLTLFVFSTKDGWVTIMYDGLDAVDVDMQPITNYQKWNVLYFVAFLLLAGFVVLNMLVGVVVENFQKCRDLLEKDRLAEKERERAKRLQLEADDEEAEDFAQPRRIVHLICTHGYFDLGIAAVIVLNIICMGMEHYDQPEAMSEFLKWANYVFTGVFIIEGGLKIYALGFKKYIKERWNQLDLLIILLSIVGIVLEEMNSQLPINPTIIRVMRVLRIARVLKLLKTAEGIRKLLDTVAEALPQVANLGLLFLLLFFIFAALGMELFGEIECTDAVPCEGLDEHAHFKNFGFAMLTLFRVSTGDNWNGILKDIINEKRCEQNPSQSCSALEHIAPIYFAVFVLATQFVLLNVVVAVLMKHLEEAKETSVPSSREGTDTAFAIQSDSVDGEGEGGEAKYPKRATEGETADVRVSVPSRRGPNSTAKGMVGCSVRNESLSSISSIEQTVKTVQESRGSSENTMLHLQPVDPKPSDQSNGLATLRLPLLGSQSHSLNTIEKVSGKIYDSSLSELSSPENEQGLKMSRVSPMSPRAPIYVMSEDSDLNDSKVDDEQDSGKLFRPVHSPTKSKHVVHSVSSPSSSEDETKGKKTHPRKPHNKSDSRKGKPSKKDSKTTSDVSPPTSCTSAKSTTRWALPVSRDENEMKLRDRKPRNGDDTGKSYKSERYV